MHDRQSPRSRTGPRPSAKPGQVITGCRKPTLSWTQLAEAAILPEAPGDRLARRVARVTPSQFLRCAPALQLSEAVLLDALEGKRDTLY
ncbi:hypothetical protein [Streptomyces fuscichromogenes]|uniref:Uncharacterized protein n=1 Tax=Streptomyces fuscichromogenes TaxID=1324013 RepID=A0A918CUT9_9ACTN|nr:hypothetical protein [Streptomyces fuscichromogenes]GGN31059.1 hypothetical protein GCM10011578_068690 [Streptomyces fuscichromogenes]